MDGVAGLVGAQVGRPRVVFDFAVTRGTIVEIEMVADPERLESLDLVMLDT